MVIVINSLPKCQVLSYQSSNQDKSLPIWQLQDISKPPFSVHAATLAHLQFDHPVPKNQLMAAWFAGSREGAKDVQIFASYLDLSVNTTVQTQTAKSQWTTPKVIINRQQLGKQSNSHIKKLGNPVLYQAKDGTVHLFVVATSYGGWAASKIYHLISNDGEDFGFKQILPLSPLLNVSHLVRATPVALADGGFLLPIYHELVQKFEIILRFDANGNLIQKIRPNDLKQTLQPWLLPISSQQCLLVRRHRYSTAMLVQSCQQGGFVWSKPQTSNINNDNNSANLVNFGQQHFLIHNQPSKNSSRYYLWLSTITADPMKGYTVEKKVLLDKAGETYGEVSYPTTLAVDDNLHVIYTYDRKVIRHLMFNTAWLNQQMACHLSMSNKPLSKIAKPMLDLSDVCQQGGE